jgi:hypothetical protein
LLGLLCAGVGLLVLIWRPETVLSVLAVATPTEALSPSLTPVPSATPTATIRPTNTPSPTETPPPTEPAPTATQPAAAANPADTFPLTILHSNDTWGYTLPCG